MNRKLQLFALVVCALAISTNLSAQSKAKYAHLNSSDLMQVMPGRDSAQKVLETLNAQLEDELKSMYAEYQNKADQFQKEQATMSQAMQQTKLQDLKKRIETFQEQAQGELQEKQEELLKPLVDKAKAAIAKVAKENGYTYVFDSAVGALLYYEGGDDIIELVKKELKIK